MSSLTWKSILDERTARDIARSLWIDPAKMSMNDLPPAVREKVLSEKNSNEACGRRMAERLRRLRADPVFLLPDYDERYGFLLEYCESLSPLECLAMNSLLGQDSSLGYAPIPKPKDVDIRLPRDNAALLGFQRGWHFVVGNFRGRDPSGASAEYGAELVVIQYSLFPPGVAHEMDLSDMENQIVDVQFALSQGGDPGRHIEAVPLVLAGTTGLIEFGNHPFVVAAGKQRMESLEPDELFPMRLQARDVETGHEVDLYLGEAKPWFLQGDNGCAPSLFGLGTLYYSVSAIKLDETKSRVVFAGEEIDLEPGGRFWFDHEWSTGFMPGGCPDSKLIRAIGNVQEFLTRKQSVLFGWDWFCLQFDEGYELTLSAMHTDAGVLNQTGPEPPGRSEARFAISKIVRQDGSAVDANGTVTITDWHKSDTTGVWLPDGYDFKVEGADVPGPMRHFLGRPINQTGQNVHSATGEEYREGPILLLEPATGREIGRGYAEAAGYPDTTPAIMRSAGLPVSDETLATVTPAMPSGGLAAKSAAYLASLVALPLAALWMAARRILRAVRAASP